MTKDRCWERRAGERRASRKPNPKHQNTKNGEPMKRNKRNNPSPGQSPAKPVHIEFTHASATAVAIAGSFNEWRPQATPMIRLDDGRWVKELVLPPGTYEYCVVVDGAWVSDPRANETVPNPFGGQNSVLRVAAPV